ncbi:DNA adenine methylase [Staphylococcus equorum]
MTFFSLKNDFKYPKVNYIGNKEKLSEWIVDNLPLHNGSVLDIFSGGNSVAFELKLRGYKVISNDVLYASFVVAKSIIENKKTKLNEFHIDNAKNIELTDIDKQNFSWLVNKLYYPEEVIELAKLVKYSQNMSGYEKYVFQALIRRSMIRKLPYSRMNVPWNSIIKLRDEDYSYKKYGRKRAYHNETFTSHIRKNLSDYNSSIFDNGEENFALQKDALKVLDEIDFVDIIYMDPPYPSTMNKYDEFYGAFDKVFEKEKEHFDLTNKKTSSLILKYYYKKRVVRLII